MKPSEVIIGPVRRFVKAIEVATWLAFERLAKAILTRSFRHVTPAQRHRRAAHSDALHKAPIIQYRARISIGDRN